MSIQSSPLAEKSLQFAIEIVTHMRPVKGCGIIKDQILRAGTSIGANIREAQYAHGKADFIAKLQIALKEANETGYWLELLYKTNYISEEQYRALDSTCTSIRVMLIASINTAKENLK
jgi:four helix bundle protein